MSQSSPEYLRFFPYGSPYDHQREAMDSISGALDDGRDVLFEGACGTGKTLAALVPALEHARRTDKTVVITTNVHQQTRQFIEEARAITRKEPIRTVVFRGKSSMCHIDVGYEECQALRDTTKELVEVEQDRAELGEMSDELLDEAQEGAESPGTGGAAADEATASRQAVMDEMTALETELEELREQSVCEYYRKNLVADTDPFYEWLFEDVRTPDDIYEHAHEEGFCGYELLKEGMEGVDLVVCNYHHLLDPMIREQFFRWLGRDPEDVVVVFDEAHNVEDAARDHATRALAEPTLDSALAELAETADPRVEPAENVVSAFREALVTTYEEALAYGEREEVGEDWYDLSITNDRGRDDLTLAFLDAYTGQGIHEDLDVALELGKDLDRQYHEAYKDGETRTRKECRVLQAATFVDDWLRDSDEEGQYPVVSVREPGRFDANGSDDDAGERAAVDANGNGQAQTDGGTAEDAIYGRAELYTCIPRRVTEPLFDELHASVLMSATLRPFDVLGDVLGLSGADLGEAGDENDDPDTDGPVEMAYGAVFPEERRRTYAVDIPALFASKREERDTQTRVASALADAVKFTPGNTLAFFPSYREAERYHDLLGTAGIDATRYLDRPGERAEELRQRFTADDDGVLFTSLWGTLAEGVSFDDDDARTVVVVGVPYPHLDDRMNAVQDAYETAFDGTDVGWQYAVEVPTVRKTRQALGRVVRSPADFGVRILLDERYTKRARREMKKYSVKEAFPAEERVEQIDIDPSKLKFAMLNFYSDMEAWDGSPPRP
ncbi:helicase C-terminal domain-containing protein [Halomarina oriensis]|uniref:DEAD/DEAH box helicase n=1 Tax=Halomarina oriensis TaxID=671145 RepID=A0A6B0GKD1_9EURY|nr:DEAD/DEAH box helicase [Halomarina oriensis]